MSDFVYMCLRRNRFRSSLSLEAREALLQAEEPKAGPSTMSDIVISSASEIETRLDTVSEPDSEASELSPESSRIQGARAQWDEMVGEPKKRKTSAKSKPKAKATKRARKDLVSVSSEEGEGAPMLSHPKSSSVFDVLGWAIEHKLTDAERENIERNGRITVSSMNTGMAMDDIALMGIEHAMRHCGFSGVEFARGFKCENNPKKLSWLEAAYPSTKHFFSNNTELAMAISKDTQGNRLQRPPHCDVLTMGISCKDISGLTTKPKSINDKGESGATWRQLWQYLERLPFEARPRALCLECTALLGARRQVSNFARDTEHITNQLSTIGYDGRWAKLDALEFNLPQSRPRCYGVFLLRARPDNSSRSDDIDRALSIIRRLKLLAPETLKGFLERNAKHLLDHAAQLSKGKNDEEKAGQKKAKWRDKHDQFVQRHGVRLLASSDRAAFFEQVRAWSLSQREVDAAWLSLSSTENGLFQWQRESWAIDLNLSLQFGSVRPCLPCLARSSKVLIHTPALGLRRPRPMLLLAGQGIEDKEVNALAGRAVFGDDALLADFAGNAFAANVVGAILVAILVVL